MADKFGGLDLRPGAKNSPLATIADDISIEGGTIKPRKAHSSLTSNAVAAIDGIFTLLDTLWGMAVAGGVGKLYKVIGTPPNTLFDTAITGTAYTSGAKPVVERIAGKAYIVDGSVSKVFDGTTITTMGVHAKPTDTIQVGKIPSASGTPFTGPAFYTTSAPATITAVDTTIGAAVTNGSQVDRIMFGVSAWDAAGKESIERQTGIVAGSLRTYTGAGAGFSITWDAVAGATYYTVYLLRVGSSGGNASLDLYFRQKYSTKIAAPATAAYFTATALTSGMWSGMDADTQVITGAAWKDAAGAALGTPSTTILAPSTSNSFIGKPLSNSGVPFEETLRLNSGWISDIKKVMIAKGGITKDTILTSLTIPISVIGGATGGSPLTCSVYRGATALANPETGELLGHFAGTGYPAQTANAILNANQMPVATFNFSGIESTDGTSTYYFVVFSPQGKLISVPRDTNNSDANSACGKYITGWEYISSSQVSFAGASIGIIAPLASGTLDGEYIYAYSLYSPTLGLETDIKTEANNKTQTYKGEQASVDILDTFTVTIASPAVFAKTAHGYVEGDGVIPITTGALPTGLTAGTTYYVIATGLTADAFQVSTSIGGAAVNTSGTQSGVHSITPAIYTYYRIYRQGGAHANFMLVAEVLPSAVPYIDGKSDLILSTACETIGVGPPPALNGIVYLNGRLYGWNDTTIYVSEPWPLVESWKTGINFFPISDTSAKIKQCVPYAGELLVLCSDGVRLFSGDTEATFAMRTIPGAPGASSKRGAALADGVVMYLSPKGIYAVNSYDARPVLSNELATLFDATDANYQWGIDANAVALFHDKHFLLSYPTTIAKTLIIDGKHPDLGLLAYVDSGDPTTTGPTALHYDAVNQRVVFGAASTGSTEGKLYHWRGGAVYTGFNYQTVTQDLGDSDVMKWFHQLIVDLSGPVTVALYLDETSVTLAGSGAIANTARDRTEFSVDAYGRRMKLKFTGTAATAEVFNYLETHTNIVGGHR